MTIQNIKLSDKFHVWVAATNLTIEEINREIVLEAKQKLKTLDKSTIVGAINELYDKKLNRDENLDLSDNDIVTQSVLANTKIQVGSEGKGNSYVEFYDDTTNLYRKFLFNHENKKWYVENGDGELEEVLTPTSTIDGNTNIILLKRLPDSEFNEYTGPEGSLSYNLVTKNLHVHDGFTKGGLSLIDSFSFETDKVKIDFEDGSAGYLLDKLNAGNGIQVVRDYISGKSVATIINGMYSEFSDVAGNTYVKRNNSNKFYQFLTKDEVINDLEIGRIYSNKKNFNNVINLEDNVYTYISNISDENTVINFNSVQISHIDRFIEFTLILDSSIDFNVFFEDAIKWNNNEDPSEDTLEAGIYVYKFRTYNKGLFWLGKLDSFYPKN